MKTKEFLSQLDHDRLVGAIQEAETHTTGEIHVYVSHRQVKDAFHAAVRHFHTLGLSNTQHRNAVLIFVAPRSRAFAVIGDENIHTKSGEALWNQIVAQMREHFQLEQFTDGLIQAIRTVGQSLAQLFPRGPSHASQQSDLLIDR